jgi:hypothetical protein
MDSRVAVTVAGTLFDVQTAHRREVEAAEALAVKAECEKADSIGENSASTKNSPDAPIEPKLENDDDVDAPIEATRKRAHSELNNEPSHNGDDSKQSTSDVESNATIPPQGKRVKFEQCNGSQDADPAVPMVNGGGALSPMSHESLSPKESTKNCSRKLDNVEEASTAGNNGSATAVAT